MIPHEPIAELAAVGFQAFTTTRDAGSFNSSSNESFAEVMERWNRLIAFTGAPRFATARQVHGTIVHEHGGDWTGWLRASEGDGHFTAGPRTTMAVTVADCVPVFLAHPGGAAAVIHAGWRGTAAGILRQGVERFERSGVPAAELVAHLGPSICGACYEVGPEVFRELTGREVARPTCADLRGILAEQAASFGITRVSISRWCTRCHNDRFFSHRCGDAGRQLGVIVRAS